MTQTISFKEKLHQFSSIFKWELKSCSGILTVFSILATVFTTIVLTICLISDLYSNPDLIPLNFSNNVINVFQYASSVVIFSMTILFTIIYTIKIYSYLHDKRKADLYGSLPVSRTTLYFSKSISALAFSLIPAYFFMGIIAIISIAFGQPLVKETISLFVNLFIGSVACVSAYGLIAICCGTTINSIIMFCAVCFIYPLSASFIKSIATGFFYGTYLQNIKNSFILNALNPLAAFRGNNIIYWIIFTAVCVVTSSFLVKKRKAERAQSSFAYYLPCHLIKILIAFVCGIFVGVVLGALNVFGHGLLGFAFGFIIASASAYVISHLIFYKGFSNIVKTLIPLAALIVVSITGISLCCFDLSGYNKYVPESDSILSAGIINYQICYLEYNPDLKKVVTDSVNDFNDSEYIDTITDFHNQYLNDSDFSADKKFQNVLFELILGNLYSESPDYSVAYKLDNGKTVTRIYKSSSFNDLENITSYQDLLSKVLGSSTYFVNYSATFNADTKHIVNLTAFTDSVESFVYSKYGENNISQVELNKLLNALHKDMELDDDLSDNLSPIIDLYDYKTFSDYTASSDNEYICFLSIDSNSASDIPHDELIGNIFFSSMYYPQTIAETILISSDYQNTIAVLQELGIVDSNLSLLGDSMMIY